MAGVFDTVVQREIVPVAFQPIRDPAPGPAAIRELTAVAGKSAFRTELRPLSTLAAMRTDWESLAERAVEANLFAEPAFVLTACETLAGGERARAALIWDDDRACDPRHRLRGFFLLAGGRFGGPFASARTWRPLHSASGIPLIDRDCTDAVLAAFLDLFVAEGASTAGAIFPMAAADGPFALALRRFAAATGREVASMRMIAPCCIRASRVKRR